MRVANRIRDLLPGKVVQQLDERLRSDKSISIRIPLDLAALPWELLPVGDTSLFLGEECCVGRHTFTSRADVEWRDVGNPVRVLIVCDPNKVDGDVTAFREGKRLRRRLNRHSGRVQVEMEFEGIDSHELLARLQDVDILHFAGHADIRQDDENAVTWRTSASGKLDCRQIHESHNRQWPILVFANACAPAPVDRPFGESGLDAMAQAFLERGVRHYVGAFTKIPGCEEVVQFADTFYEQLLRSESVGAALRAARRSLGRIDTDNLDERGRLIAANYLHYGAPDGTLFEPQGQTTSPGPSADREHGSVAAGYEILDRLAQSDYRVIDRARPTGHSSDGACEVALATPYQEGEKDAERQVIAYRDVQPLVDHPGLVRIDDVIFDRQLLVVYELVPNARSLDELLRETGPFTLNRVVELTRQVGDALTAAHAQRLSHGRLTPRDILCTSSADEDTITYKVLDVGRLQVMNRANIPLLSRPEREQYWRKYAAPELRQTRDSAAHATTDVWALAVIAYELLTGHHPFEHGQEEGSNDQLPYAQPCPLFEYRPDLPGRVDQVFLQALARTPQERLNKANELTRLLRRAAQGAPRIGGFRPDLQTALEAGATLLCIRTDDVSSALDKLAEIGQQHDRELYCWRMTTGLTKGRSLPPCAGQFQEHPLGALGWLDGQERNTLLAMLDLDAYLEQEPAASVLGQGLRLSTSSINCNPPPQHGEESWDTLTAHAQSSFNDEQRDRNYTVPTYPQERLVRDLGDLATSLRFGRHSRSIVMLCASEHLPRELSKVIQVFELLPASESEVEDLVRTAADADLSQGDTADQSTLDCIPGFSWHASGLTRREIAESLRLTITHGDGLASCVADLKQTKEQVVRRNGLLELRHPTVTLDDVIGLDKFQTRMKTIGRALDAWVKFGLLPPPRGVLLGGMPGCGKSFCASAIAGTWGWPLLRLDVGAIFGGLVGQSEANMRQALAMTDAMSPVVLWVDEIEKGFGQLKGGGMNGAAGRVFETLLVWLQERTSCVYLVGTANEGRAIPPELVRAGRFDGAFYIDLPNHVERAELLKCLFRKHGRIAMDYNWDFLAEQTDGNSSAELESRVVTSLFAAAQHGRILPTPAELEAVLRAEPLPRAMRHDRDEMQQSREFWLSFAEPASSSCEHLEIA